jgi:diguanylate cyclase (GGDEF)-like protein
MNLKARILLLTAAIFVAAALAGWLATRALTMGIIEEWAERRVRIQVLYHKSRALEPLLRELALARQMARAPAIIDWAREPDNPQYRAEALTELESYRENFREHSYFLALADSGRYYHNNAKNEFAGAELRYVLDSAKDNDQWFFELLRQKHEVQVNVEPKEKIDTTNVWINALVRDGERVLGVAGTSLDLANFIQGILDSDERGVTSLFIDTAGAIQLHKSEALIDYAPLTKKVAERKTIFTLLDSDSDRANLRNAMAELQGDRQTAVIPRITIAGKSYLAGLTALPEIGWYEITLLDLDVLLPLNRFAGITLVFMLSMLVALALLALALNRLVLRPLEKLNEAMAEVAGGKPPPANLSRLGLGEMRVAMTHFTEMANTVLASRSELEEKVRERTADLERLSRTDPMTGLLNRRGMTEQIAGAISRARREQHTIGVLWVDVDWFKEINDRHGHATGDEALKAITALIHACIRPYDHGARWGGDEFLVLLSPIDTVHLDVVGVRIRKAVADYADLVDEAGRPVKLSVSIGGHLLQPGDDLDSLLNSADQALYTAKSAGRNCYRRLPVPSENQAG